MFSKLSATDVLHNGEGLTIKQLLYWNVLIFLIDTLNHFTHTIFTDLVISLVTYLYVHFDNSAADKI